MTADDARRAEIVVVGAGLGGLAAAAHLAGRGHRVTVLERADQPGGRAGRWCHEGFRFDTGPTVLTMRGLLESTFAAAGSTLEEHLDLVRLDPVYRASFWDGSTIDVHAKPDAMAEEIGHRCGPADQAGYLRFVDWLGQLFDNEFGAFINRDFDSPLDLIRQPGALVRLVGLGGFRRLDDRVATFFTDQRLRRLFSFQAMYAGLSPLRALALYGVIAHMDTVEGVWFPRGGIQAIADGLARAVEKAGGEIRYDHEVVAMAPSRPGTRAEVRTADGQRLRADAVVVNAELAAAAELFGLPPRRSVARAHHSPSCVLWLIGARAPAPADHDGGGDHGSPGDLRGPAHHNIHFGRAWDTSFRELLDQGRPMADPSRFVTVASLTDPTAAPAGHHTLNVIEPVPNLTADLDWSSQGPALTDRMLAWATAEGYLDGPPTALRAITPLEWRAQGMGRGTPFAFDHRFSQSGPFRPGLTDRRLPGVVFVGSSTRPGVGVPMVLISGRLAADRAEESLHG